MIHRILVAVKQPSGPQSAALLKAAQLAHALNAELLLFHAVEIPLLADAYTDNQRRLGDDQNKIRQELMHELESQAATLRGRGVAVTVAAEWDFPAAEAILRHANRRGSDLLVIGQAMHGSDHAVVEQVIRHSPIAALVLRTPAPYEAPALLAAVKPQRRPARPGELGGAICRITQSIGTALRGSWSVVTVSRGRVASHARTTLIDILPQSGLAPRAIRVATGHPSSAILETAAVSRARIIVLGAGTTSGFVRLVSGSTLRQVLNRAAQDILVVKPAAFALHFSTRTRGAHILSASTPPIG